MSRAAWLWDRLSDGYLRSIAPAPKVPTPSAWRDDRLTVAWLGHATLLVNFFGLWLVTDPALLKRVGIRAGVVTNRRKTIDRGKTVFTFAMGQKAMYDFLNDNPAIASAPVDYVNDPRIIAQNDNVISINATPQIVPTGACKAEHMLD